MISWYWSGHFGIPSIIRE